MKSFVQANFIVLFSICQVEAILLVHQSARLGLSFPNLEGFFISVSLVYALNVDRDLSRITLNGKRNYA